MKTNHQMNYYDYAKTLSAEGVMTALIGGGAGPEPEPETDWVNLGLPSGTLWAKHNIQDADGNELYFAWGETQGYTAEQVGNEEGKKAFVWGDYEFGYKNALTKYNGTDGKTVLDVDDDAATANWGDRWRMPTKEEFEELLENTEYEWTTANDVQGAKFTSTVEGYTDKFLFFPAVGSTFNGETSDVGVAGCYWSVSLDVNYFDKAFFFAFDNISNSTGIGTYNRSWGLTVRPVRSNN